MSFQNFDNLRKAIEYAEELRQVHFRMPHGRCIEFCKRQNAPLGSNIWIFLMKRAEEMEHELEELKSRLKLQGNNNG